MSIVRNRWYQVALIFWILTVILSPAIPPILVLYIPAILWLWFVGLSLFGLCMWLGNNEY